MYGINDIFNNLGESSSSMHYTEEEIEAARKRQKKMGGTFMENLQIIAGDKKTPEIGGSMTKTEDISSLIKDINSNINTDQAMMGKPKVKEDISINALDKFKGVIDDIKSDAFGQDDFIKKLIVAFKRPFVSELDDNDALNSIYIYGPSCSGKHFILDNTVKCLSNRKIISSGEIFKMNLALYPTQGEETLFIQDLYNALSSSSTVILFENFENCHVSLLSKLSDLVTKGECMLNDRYVMKSGQLVNVSNTLSGNTVGSLEAKGKYLIFISDKSLDKLAGSMGAPFVNALGDVCNTVELNDEALNKISENEKEALISKAKKQLSFELLLEDNFMEYMLGKSSKGRGLKGILDAYQDIMKGLSQLRLERDDIEENKIVIKPENEELNIFVGEEKILLNELLPGGYNGELESVKRELEGIVGLKEVKDYIYSLEEYFGVQKKRREAGLKASEVNKHMIFTGNPGTGKTTIARIVSKYLKAIGVLSGGQLVEVSRADLVGRFVGHTAPLVSQVIKSALGGVLFIDEAYSLYRGHEDNFGLEAIDTLVKGIEDNRDDLIVILAGYSKEMEEFLESNSGLKSRFPNIIEFPDYTGEELLKIAKITASSKGYNLSEEVDEALLQFFDEVQSTNAREAGNGRLVRNKIEEAILNQSKRLVAEKEADLSTLVVGDFELE